MSLAKSVQPVSVLKTRTAELIRQACDSGEPVIITQNGRATAVLRDIASYERERDSLLLLKLMAEGEQEVRRGAGVPHADVKARFEEKLRLLKSE